MGISASPGAAIGKVVFDADRAERLGNEGEKIILTRIETKPEDIHGFFAAQGILTSRGGKTSHAAVVARGMGKPCVSGVEGLDINYDLKEARVGNVVIKEGDIITLDGTNGTVLPGHGAHVGPGASQGPGQTDGMGRPEGQNRGLGQRRHPGHGRQGQASRRQGHRPVPHRAHVQRRGPSAPDAQPDPGGLPGGTEALGRQAHAHAAQDFVEIFKAMEGLPVTIRLLDPPLHEFLPSIEELINEVSRLKEFSAIINALEQLPGTVSMLDPELYKFVPSIEAVARELGEVKAKGLDQKLLAG